jgi:hypothetical protein
VTFVRRILSKVALASVLVLTMALMLGSTAFAAPQTLTVLGASGVQGTQDSYTEYSMDDGSTWQRAWLSGWHPWDFVPGTNSWINCDPSGTSWSCLYRTVLYRVRFNVPDDFTNPQMQFAIKADNFAKVWLNGTFVTEFAGENSTAIDTTIMAALQPGLNEIRISVRDEGGWAGLNYKLTLTGDAAAPPTTLPSDVTPPVAALVGPNQLDEGHTGTWTVNVSDTLSGVEKVEFDPGTGTFAVVTGQASVAAGFADNSTPTLRLRATDVAGNVTVSPLALTVSNVNPTVTALTVPAGPVPVNSAVAVSASFTDPGVLDTHAALVNWGDGNTSVGTVAESGGSGSVSASHTYGSPGVHLISVTVSDKDGGTGSRTADTSVVIYDQNGGFVTGGGWIDSPAGAYTSHPSLTGKATFGFVAKYLPGANVPSGQTQFHLKAANLTFASTSYEWLIVSGARAEYKGNGTINGAGNYSFILTAIGGDVPGGGGADKFRLKIWGASGVVYDNDPTTVLGSGSIVIHK